MNYNCQKVCSYNIFAVEFLFFARVM